MLFSIRQLRAEYLPPTKAPIRQTIKTRNVKKLSPKQKRRYIPEKNSTQAHRTTKQTEQKQPTPTTGKRWCRPRYFFTPPDKSPRLQGSRLKPDETDIPTLRGLYPGRLDGKWHKTAALEPGKTILGCLGGVGGEPEFSSV